MQAAEACPFPLERITYVRVNQRVAGIAAVGRSLEHVNLAWVVASWITRLPGLEQLLQLIADAIGYGPQPDRLRCRWASGAGGRAPGCSR